MSQVGLFDWFRKDDDGPSRPRKPDPNRVAPKHPVHAIEREVLDLIIESARNAHPNEFAGALRAEGGVITTVLLVPGTVQGSRHAILRMNELPIDRTVVGVVHSHPSNSARPSQADLMLFGQHGHTHIIIHHPYTVDTWLCWNHRGERVKLDVI